MDTSLPEEVLLDENAEAKPYKFYSVGGTEVSPNHKLLAYAVDTVGGEKYTLHVRNLATGKELLSRPIEVLPLCQGGL
jgi:oligopeptidase B